jgi:hypothetical protein
MEVSYLVGDLIEVDLNTLHRDGPIRVKLGCTELNKIRGETKVFFNGEGYNIRWELETQIQEPSKSTSKFERRRGLDDDEEEEKEEEGEFNEKENTGTGKQKDGEGAPSYMGQNERRGETMDTGKKNTRQSRKKIKFMRGRKTC